MVGLNYNLKERTKREGERGGDKEGEGRQVIRSSSVSFTEGRGTFSTLVSASTRALKKKVDV